jgi:hypothetical protein
MLALTAAYIRTHRERKEAYTRSLEQEVVRLRANEANFLRELTELRALMVYHGIEVPKTQGHLQPSNGSASLFTSGEDVFELNIRLTNTREKRRQIQVVKPSSHTQHNLVASSKQSSLSPYRTHHAVVFCHSR